MGSKQTKMVTWSDTRRISGIFKPIILDSFKKPGAETARKKNRINIMACEKGSRLICNVDIVIKNKI